MDLQPAVIDRIKKLVPMLSSDRDGEVLATVSAIRRVLASAGADIHTLSAAIGQRPPRWEPPPREPPRQKAEADARAREVKRVLEWMLDQSDINDWEERFIDSMLAKIKTFGTLRLTDKQEAVLDGLLMRARDGGCPQ